MGTRSTACPPCTDTSSQHQRSAASGCRQDTHENRSCSQLSHPDTLAALWRLRHFGSLAMCEATPYQAASEIMCSGQEQLSMTLGASVAEARAQLLALQATIRGQLYATYLDQCLSASPEFRDRGRRVGTRILTQLLSGPASSRISQVHYADEAGLRGKIPPPPQPPPAGWLSGGMNSGGGVVAGSYDSALIMLDGLAQPFLDPFVEGLKEPFMRAVEDYQAKVQSTVTSAAIGGLLGGIAAGLVTGFIIGRFAGRGGHDKGSE